MTWPWRLSPTGYPLSSSPCVAGSTATTWLPLTAAPAGAANAALAARTAAAERAARVRLRPLRAPTFFRDTSRALPRTVVEPRRDGGPLRSPDQAGFRHVATCRRCTAPSSVERTRLNVPAAGRAQRSGGPVAAPHGRVGR